MTKKEFIRIFKRFIIAFLCCLPIFILIGIFLREKIGNVWTVVIYVIIGIGAYVLAEIICKRHEQKMELKREKSRLKRRYQHLSHIESVKTDDSQKKEKKSKTEKQTKE